MPTYKILRPTKQKLNTKRIYGFDIETYGQKNKFYMGSLYSDDLQYVFYDKKNFVKLLKSGFFNDSIIVASNLGFDFFGIFFSSREINNFKFIFRGSELIYARTYVYNGKLNNRHLCRKDSVTFLDTFNYAKMSVDKLGKIIGIRKLEKPKFLGKRPKNDKEKRILEDYNLRDSMISCKGLEFLYSSFQELGATPKLTLASTSMSLFRNKYLENDYFRHDKRIIREIFRGYYGGRSETFCRGTIAGYNYYDFNSLYPSVMRYEYPDPNSLKLNRKNSDFYLLNYDGMSEVTINCPRCEYPLLPLRFDDKLIFPTGTFRGYYTNIELRKAIELGYKILKIHRNIYYTRNCRPFKGFVEDLYNLREENKKTPMEKVIKILMNSLYGKFGQKFDERENLIPFNHTAEELRQYKKFEIVGKRFLRVVESTDPAVFCVPIWCSYVTAYGRLRLHEYMLRANPIYVDTDSLITRKKFKDSKELGDLKLEMTVSHGCIVKPKFYLINDIVKSKGIGRKLKIKDFYKIMDDPTITYKKFMKIKESLRRGYLPNEIIDVTKRLVLEDNKRDWDEKDFDYRGLEMSRPHRVLLDGSGRPFIYKGNKKVYKDCEVQIHTGG